MPDMQNWHVLDKPKVEAILLRLLKPSLVLRAVDACGNELGRASLAAWIDDSPTSEAVLYASDAVFNLKKTGRCYAFYIQDAKTETDILRAFMSPEDIDLNDTVTMAFGAKGLVEGWYEPKIVTYRLTEQEVKDAQTKRRESEEI